MMSWPDEINPGMISGSAVHHFDIFPTITSAAQVNPSNERILDGVDLLPHTRPKELSELLINFIKEN